MSQTTATASNSGFFSGYFNNNGNNQPPIPLMSTMAVPPPPPSDSVLPPPPPPSTLGSNGELSLPPPPPIPTLPKLDMSIPPPSVPTADAYQNWALQWSLFQQAQQAAYQSQLYQSFANQQNSTPVPVPPVNNVSNGYNPQQQNHNNNMNTTPSKWQPSNSSSTFRPRQAQQSYRARYQANNNNNQQFNSYNNVPPPSNLNQSRPRQPGIRFQLNTHPQPTTNKSGRRTRFSSPPKQQMSSPSLASYPTPMATPPENRHDDTMMDTTNSNDSRPIMNAVQAFKLACDKQNWPDSLKKYWQSIENRCSTNLLRSQADEWFQGVLVDAFQKNLVTTTDWLNRPIPEFLLRPDLSANVRSNTFDSTNSSLLQIAKSSYAENKQREDLIRLNKLRTITSESVQRAFGNNDDDDDDDETPTSSSRKRSSSSSSSSSSTSDNDSNNRLKNMASPQPFIGGGRKRSKKPRRGKKSNKKMQFDEYKPEQCERLEKRRNRFTNESTSTIIKLIQAPGASSNTVSDNNKAMVGTCQKLEKNYLRLTSEADPLTIRPLSILERAFSFVMNKYRLNKDWSYISDQLKSIRQDLMVQCIRNDFTVLVYEENARLSLEMGDREQFNQCQTQLETLYDNGCSRTHINEFLIYRLLYSLLLNDYKKTNRILIDIDTVKKIAAAAAAANGKSKTKDIEHLDLALDLCTAIRRKNYIRFFIIYRSLPQLASCLVNLFIDIYRKQVLKVLIWGFAPSLPIETVTQMLAYESYNNCQKHLSTLGITLIDEPSSGASIDCKASRAIFEKK